MGEDDDWKFGDFCGNGRAVPDSALHTVLEALLAACAKEGFPVPPNLVVVVDLATVSVNARRALERGADHVKSIT